VDLAASGQVNLLPEYVLHNLSDSDHTFSVPAAASIELVLRDLAPEFGFDPKDAAKYNNQFRNPVLSYFTDERLYIIYTAEGRQGVLRELKSARGRVF
jgi:hypothetical protein